MIVRKFFVKMLESVFLVFGVFVLVVGEGSIVMVSWELNMDHLMI